MATTHEEAVLAAQTAVRDLNGTYYGLTATVNRLNQQILAKGEVAHLATIVGHEANAKVAHKELAALRAERAVAKSGLDYLKSVALPDAHSKAMGAEVDEMIDRSARWSATAKEERAKLLEGFAATGDAGAGAEIDLSKTNSQKLADEARSLFLSAADLKARLVEDVEKREEVKRAYRARQME